MAFGGLVGIEANAGAFTGADAGALALRWLESVTSGLLLVDGELNVHWSNSIARGWIASQQPLSLVGTRLHLGRSQEQLRKLLNRADLDFDGICVPLEGRGSHLVVSARRITAADEAPFYGLIARRTDDLNTRLLGVDEAFRLTGAEARVLKLLIRGKTAQGIAGHLDISVDTVRTHIRNLYTKLGVSSREALFMRLRPFMIAN